MEQICKDIMNKIENSFDYINSHLKNGYISGVLRKKEKTVCKVLKPP